MLRLIAILLLCIATAAPSALAAMPAPNSYFVSGMVRDSVTFQPVPYASVSAPGSAVGALTDEKGLFQLSVPLSASSLQVACLGYDKKTVPIKKGKVNLYDIHLSPVATELAEVVVHRKKYSKRNNPAVDFARRLRQSSPLTDPRRHDFYNYDRYQISTLALSDFGSPDTRSGLFKQFPFISEHLDTSEISGKPILDLIVKEQASTVNYRRSPRSQKETITGTRQSGIDEIADQASVSVFLQDVMGEVDLYANDINLLRNRFVSPLSKIAPDFYKFYLSDTVMVDSQLCIALSFYPHNPATCGFNGQVYVPVGDSTMFIKKVTMRTPRDINLNFISSLYISQDFAKAPDGSRLKLADNLTVEGKVVKGTPGVYARRSIAYTNHNFLPPENPDIFSALGSTLAADSAALRSDQYWDARRAARVSDSEKGVDKLMTRLRSTPIFYWSEKALKILVNGYVATGKDSKVDLGPVNTLISHNTLEGWRLRVGGLTTANLSKHLFARGYLAYGTLDKKLKYSAELEYSFAPKAYHSREFPIHSLRFTSLYDVDDIGQHYLHTNADNFFLSLKRMPSHTATYHRVSKLEYTLELRNNLSVMARLDNTLQYRSRFVSFTDGHGSSFSHYSLSGITLQLRYAPGEKYYQTKSHRLPISRDAPVFTLSHRFAPKGILGNTFPLSVTEASIQKRFWLSAWGHLDALAKGAHVWTRSPFPQLIIPSANTSYIILPESFALLNPMEFITDTNLSLFLTYNANGAILNCIPGVKRLKLREVFGIRGFHGHLSRRNNPARDAGLLRFPQGAGVLPLASAPYLEASAGLDNILSCLRVDYVWRLTYRHTPYPIDRSGLRIALHFTF